MRFLVMGNEGQHWTANGWTYHVCFALALIKVLPFDHYLKYQEKTKRLLHQKITGLCFLI